MWPRSKYRLARIEVVAGSSRCATDWREMRLAGVTFTTTDKELCRVLRVSIGKSACLRFAEEAAF